MSRIGKRRKPNDLVTAQEIACFAYCPEQWRLQYGGEKKGTSLTSPVCEGRDPREHARKRLMQAA